MTVPLVLPTCFFLMGGNTPPRSGECPRTPLKHK